MHKGASDAPSARTGEAKRLQQERNKTPNKFLFPPSRRLERRRHKDKKAKERNNKHACPTRMGALAMMGGHMLW